MEQLWHEKGVHKGVWSCKCTSCMSFYCTQEAWVLMRPRSFGTHTWRAHFLGRYRLVPDCRNTESNVHFWIRPFCSNNQNNLSRSVSGMGMGWEQFSLLINIQLQPVSRMLILMPRVRRPVASFRKGKWAKRLIALHC